MSNFETEVVNKPEDIKPEISSNLCQKYIAEVLSNQDFLQRLYLIMGVSIELYRVLVSSLLIIFIPQNCGGKLCTMKENLESKDYTYNVGLIFNFTTLGSFILLYAFEISRENKLIKYLEVNPRNPRDNESLEVVFNKIPAKYHDKIYRVDSYYQKISYICVLLFIVNVVLSGIVVYQYSLGNQTTTNYITNILFMATKVYDTYYVANTDKSIFYSAYMRDHVQFNDIDPNLQKRLSLNSIDTLGNVGSLFNGSEYHVVDVSSNIIEHENDIEDENDIIDILLNEIVDKISKVNDSNVDDFVEEPVNKEDLLTEEYEIEQVKV
uniref:Uncharacterized protein n=1 Tax=viral metagenome TaxID=1070528 RepID=A0A6C0I0J8_9ZZZZ